jgi:hypothetical protein
MIHSPHLSSSIRKIESPEHLQTSPSFSAPSMQPSVSQISYFYDHSAHMSVTSSLHTRQSVVRMQPDVHSSLHETHAGGAASKSIV